MEALNQSFLPSIRYILNNLIQTIKSPDVKRQIFSCLLTEVGQLIKKYDEDDLKFVIRMIRKGIDAVSEDSKLEKHYESNLQRYLIDKLTEWSQSEHLEQTLTAQMEEVLQKKNITYVDSEFFRLLSEMFSTQDLALLKDYVKRFHEYPTHKNRHVLNDLVRSALGFIFDKYDHLNTVSKDDLEKTLGAMFKKRKTGISIKNRLKKLTSPMDEGSRRSLYKYDIKLPNFRTENRSISDERSYDDVNKYQKEAISTTKRQKPAPNFDLTKTPGKSVDINETVLYQVSTKKSTETERDDQLTTERYLEQIIFY